MTKQFHTWAKICRSITTNKGQGLHMRKFKIYPRFQFADEMFSTTAPDPPSFMYVLSVRECCWPPGDRVAPFPWPGPYCPLAISACLLKYHILLEYLQFDVRIRKTPNYQYLNLNPWRIFWHPIGLKFPWGKKKNKKTNQIKTKQKKPSLFVLIRILNWRKFKLMNLVSYKINTMGQTQSTYFTFTLYSPPLW